MVMMMMMKSSTSRKYQCSAEKEACIWWVEKYFKDCLCNLRDEISFGFGFVSLICWGVAEIPQIITNFTNKSGHGVSLAFLLTWVVGDVFNLVGCLLEPATLPTQYYTALLYTISTVVLVIQCIYYDYILIRWNRLKNLEITNAASQEVTEEFLKPFKPKPSSNGDSRIPIPRDSRKQPSSRKADIYYRSARSLASSCTPPFGSNSFLKIARSGPASVTKVDYSSSEDDESHSSHYDQNAKKKSSTSSSSSTTVTQPIRIPSSSVGRGTFLATAASLPYQSKALMDKYVGFSGRRLLNENGMHSQAFGVWLGWMMAAIYMGGRLPQIWLNIKRGSVEGMNPLMFIFALVANAAYVGSILVRSTAWSKIKPNMPWLLDAIVCVGLDLFIILQYVYYEYMRKRTPTHGEEHYSDYIEAEKSVTQ